MSDLHKDRTVQTATAETNGSESSNVRHLPMDREASRLPYEAVAPKAQAKSRPILIAMMFGLAALALLLPGIGTPTKMYFDEPYFVPEARAFIQGKPNPAPDAPPLAKPPLGKLIMAVGMEAAGDNPFGWRIAGGVCGALTVVAVYLWSYLLLQDRSLASLAAGLALFNNFLFVMSRIATVDVFLLFFLLWSLVAYTAALTLYGGFSSARPGFW
jgi:4-amino-4-deoxy-L-arabinose transferase-like glycosyltransferase